MGSPCAAVSWSYEPLKDALPRDFRRHGELMLEHSVLMAVTASWGSHRHCRRSSPWSATSPIGQSCRPPVRFRLLFCVQSVAERVTARDPPPQALVDTSFSVRTGSIPSQRDRLGAAPSPTMLMLAPHSSGIFPRTHPTAPQDGEGPGRVTVLSSYYIDRWVIPCVRGAIAHASGSP